MNALHHDELITGLSSKRRGDLQLHDRLGWLIREWVELTGSSRTTIWRQIRDGELHTVQVGKTRMVPRSEAIRLGLISA